MHRAKSARQNKWETIIKPKSHLLELNLSEIFRYRDLLFQFVYRDLSALYKQTILGPLWYLIQPLLTTIMFTFIFSRVAQIPTEKTPPQLFYLIGITVWSYFADCLGKTSNTFLDHQAIFGKVYFPRILVPVSVVFTGLFKFSIQFSLFLIVWFYYFYHDLIQPNLYALIVPFVLMVAALISLGFGILFTSLTTKYRDLVFLLHFAIQLWMYATPIIYPLSVAPPEFANFLMLNPITPLIEALRFGFFGHGTFSLPGLLYSTCFSFVILAIGVIAFNKIEKNFVDTV